MSAASAGSMLTVKYQLMLKLTGGADREVKLDELDSYGFLINKRSRAKKRTSSSPDAPAEMGAGADWQ